MNRNLVITVALCALLVGYFMSINQSIDPGRDLSKPEIVADGPRGEQEPRATDEVSERSLEPADAAALEKLEPEPTETTSIAEITFRRLDQNSDGLLTRAETKEYPSIDEKFVKLDDDRDGVLTQEEYAAAPTSGPQYDPKPRSE